MTIAEILASSFLLKVVIRALIVGVLVSLCASLLGVSLVLKRYSMIGDGLSHVGFCALAIAAVLNLSQEYYLEICIPIVVIAAFFILRLSENSKIKGDAAIALVSSAAIALGAILYTNSTGMTSDVCSSLFGSASVITLTDKDLWISVILSVFVLSMFVIFYKRIFALTFDERFAKSTDRYTEWYKMLIALLTAVTIVVGMRMMGSILISALIIFPAITSMRICKSFKGVVLMSATVSVLCFLVGFYVACRFEYQTGPCVVIVNLIALLLFCVPGLIRGRKN